MTRWQRTTAIALCLGACAAFADDEPSMGPRDVFVNTSLIERDAADCLIVHPANDPQMRQLAATLARQLNDLTGVVFPIKPDADILERRFVVDQHHRQTHLILLGNVNNNQAMFYLYGNHWTRVDCKWPGADGFVVQTIGNPYGTGKNVVVLGGSDIRGTRQAVDYFVGQAREAYAADQLVLPLIWKIVVDGSDRPPDSVTNGDDCMKFQSLVGAFLGSGSQSSLETVAGFLQGQVKSESPIFDCRHYRATGVAVALDLIDDTGVLDADDLLTIDNSYLKQLIITYKNRPWQQFGQTSGGSNTHDINGALEYYFPATYLLKYGNPNAAARTVLETGAAELRPFLEQAVRGNHGNYGDIDWTYGLANLCWYRYAFHDERYEIFDEGYARNQSQLGAALRRHVSTNGIAVFYYNDAKLKYLVSGGSINGWGYSIFGGDWPTPDSLEPVKPVELLGVMKILPEATQDDQRSTKTDFDRVCFMDDFTDQGYYMLIQQREHYRNCPSTPADWIRSFRYDGVELLSADSIVNDGFGIRKRSETSQLLRIARGTRTAVAQTKFPEPMGYADRYTTVIFRRGEYFVVLDDFAVTKAGKVTYVRRWRPQGTPTARGRGWEAAVGESVLRLMPSEPVRMIGAQQLQRVDAEVGEVVSFQNLLYASTPQQQRDYSMVRLSHQAALVRNERADNRPVALVGGNHAGGPVHLDEIETDAAVFYISEEVIELFDGTYLRIGGQPIPLEPAGQVLTAAGDPRLATTLAEMYEEAERALKPIVEPEKIRTSHRLVLDELWSFDGFKKRGSNVNYRVDKSDPQHWIYDLGREVRLSEIEGVRLPDGVTSIEVSRNGVDHEWQRVEVETGGRPRFGRHHYGWFHSESVSSIENLDHTCRFVRLPVDQPEGRTKYPGTHIGIEFRDHSLVASAGRIGYGGWTSSSKRHRVTDLDGDGDEELLVATDQHELLALSHRGELLWSQDIGEPIVDFYATDLNGDGRKEILLARWNKLLYILDHMGQQQVAVDVGLPPKWVGTGPYYVTALNLSHGNRSPPRKIPAVGTWNVMLVPQPDRDVSLTENWIHAIDDSWPKDSGIRENVDLNDNGRPDILMHGGQGPIVVSEVQADANGESQLRYIAQYQSLPGRYFYCDQFRLSGQAEARTILCVGEQGLAALKLTPTDSDGIEFTEVFHVPVNPISCYDLADINGDGYADIVFGKPDGYIFVVDNTGHMLAHQQLGDGVSDVQVVRCKDGQRIIAAVIDGDLTFCDTKLSVLAHTDIRQVTGLDCLRDGEEEILVVFGAQRWWAARYRR